MLLELDGSHSAEAGIAVKHRANIDRRINILGNITNIKIMANNMSITAKIIRAMALLLIAFGVSACSTYPNKFKCGDAKGLGCTMLREVDRQIDSGKIEEAYKDKKKCRGNRCSKSKEGASLTLKRQEKARLGNWEVKSGNSYLSDDEEDSILDDDNNLYF